MTVLRMYRGDDAEFTITPTIVPGEGDDLAFTAKESLADLDEDAFLAGTSFDGSVTLTEDDKISVTIAASATADVEVPTRLYWDIQGIVDGLSKTLATGSLDILLDVTRSATIES